MEAVFDSKANAISIRLSAHGRADGSSQVHDRAIVALAGNEAIEVQLLYPDMGWNAPLRRAAEVHGLDVDTLSATAGAAYASPDHPVRVELLPVSPA